MHADTIEDYRFKTAPFDHQREDFLRTRTSKAWAFFWEQGTGKTKIAIDTASWLFQQGLVEVVLVIAPNGVHRNWVSDEIPTHCPVPHRAHAWRGKGKTEDATSALRLRRWLSASKDHLGFLAMTYDSIATKRGMSAAIEHVMDRKAMIILDESTRIKNPSAQRTRAAIRLARLCEYRRILTGTPAANSPFDLWSQFDALDPQILKPVGPTFWAFRHRFGTFTRRYVGTHGFEELVGYREVETLRKQIEPYSSRVTKESALDLPEKVYVKRYVEMTPEQDRVYKQVKDDLIAEYDGVQITAANAAVALTRLQQIVSGHMVVTGEDGKKNLVDLPTRRVSSLIDLLEDTSGSAIVWARYTRDVDVICASLDDEGISFVRYDGQTTDNDREHAIRAFQAGEARVFVANPAAAGEGLTLHRATTVVYYSNSFSLTERLQSEDRAHRIGQRHPVTYVDLVSPGTIDQRIIQALSQKKDIAAQVVGDGLVRWLSDEDLSQ